MAANVPSVHDQITLGLLLVHKPVAFYLAQRYGTDGSREGMSTFDIMWDAYPVFRLGMYVTSCPVGDTIPVQESITGGLIISRTSYSAAYDYDQLLPVVAIAVGLVGSIAIGRHFTQKGKARSA